MDSLTVVFLHGAGLGGWIWDRVRPLVPALAVAPDIPSRSRVATPASCASSLVNSLDDRGVGRVVLVMHSLAGVLAPDLAGRLGERLAACVYVSAVVPAEGSTFAKAMGLPGRFLLPLLFRTRPDGLLPSEAMIQKELCTDLDAEDSTRVVDQYQAEFPGLYLTPIAAPPRCRSVYVMLSKDKCISPSRQTKMIARLEKPSVVEIKSGHLVMLSHPEKLAEAIFGILKPSRI